MPEMVTDIRGGQDQAAGIGKFLFRPQVRLDNNMYRNRRLARLYIQTLHRDIHTQSADCIPLDSHRVKSSPFSLKRFASGSSLTSSMLYKQAWSRGAPDSCLYLEETKFCNIDLLRRTSRYTPLFPSASLFFYKLSNETNSSIGCLSRRI